MALWRHHRFPLVPKLQLGNQFAATWPSFTSITLPLRMFLVLNFMIFSFLEEFHHVLPYTTIMPHKI